MDMTDRKRYFVLNVYGGYNCQELLADDIEVYARTEGDAKRENHTVMDTLRQGPYLRLLRAEGDMRARRDASSGRRRIDGEIPEGLRSYIAWCRDRKEEW